jgi:poly-gamma-glutamate capsule biosynthesis protein CapA/YwtB (metallophosphatase superfamily)
MNYTLLATGDFMIQEPVVRTDKPGMQQLWRMFGEAGHAFVNLEQALTESGEPADKLARQAASPALAAELPRANVSVVTIANNHTMDFGVPGLRNTLAALRGVGVHVVGGGEDLEESLRPAVLESDGIKVAFLGLATTLANSVGAGDRRPGLAPVRILTHFVADPVLLMETPGVSPYVETVPMPGDTERAQEAVQRAKLDADLCLVGIHWGVPIGWVAANQDELATYQVPLGHALVDAGADAVIGHHPHLLHGVELYSGRPIFYSLGNFVFHSMRSQSPHRDRAYPPYVWSSLRTEINFLGGLARLTWEQPGAPRSVELLPVWMDDDKEPALADERRARQAIDHVAACSEKFATRLDVRHDGYAWVAEISCPS